MWSVGNKSSFIPATTRGYPWAWSPRLERATAAIGRRPGRRLETRGGERYPSLDRLDAPRRRGTSAASSALDAHIELEQAMAASRKKVSAAGEASDSSAYDSSSSSSSSASGRRRRREAERKERKGKENKSRAPDEHEKRKAPKKRKDRPETKRRKPLIWRTPESSGARIPRRTGKGASPRYPENGSS